MSGIYVEKRLVGENIMILSKNGTSIGLKKSNHIGLDHFGFTIDNLSYSEVLTEQLNKKNLF